jgi:hypothetical protein
LWRVVAGGMALIAREEEDGNENGSSTQCKETVTPDAGSPPLGNRVAAKARNWPRSALAWGGARQGGIHSRGHWLSNCCVSLGP